MGREFEGQRVELAKLRSEAEYARRVREENEMLRNELHLVWEHLRRADPSSPHVYGSTTNMLAQHQTRTPSAPNTLPPLQQHQQPPPPPPPQQWSAPPPPSAMQGVEFGGMRPYEHPHR